MLLQMTVENLWSFREPAVLSFLADPRVDHRPEQVVALPDGRQVLRMVGVFGANASGKSNLLRPLERLGGLLTRGVAPDAEIPLEPFKLQKDRLEAPRQIELELYLEGRYWSYGLRTSRTQVLAEWLYTRSAEAEPERLVFEREEGAPIRLGWDGLAVADQNRRAFWSFVAEGTRPEQPFLAEARLRSGSELAPLFRWVRSLLRTLGGAQHEQLNPDFVGPLTGEMREFLLSVSRSADTGIREFRVREFDGSSDRVAMLEELDFYHGAPPEEGGLPLTFLEQSAGTRQLLSLVLQLLDSRNQAGQFLLGDELDRSLHPLLFRHLLNIFADLSRSQAPPAQLLFTSHASALLDQDILSADSLWFADKDPSGNTRLHSLADYKPEQLTLLRGHLERGYLAGRFGGIPAIRPLDRSRRQP